MAQVRIRISQIQGGSWLEVNGERVDMGGLLTVAERSILPYPKQLTVSFESDGLIEVNSELVLDDEPG
jgi:hypothetical protein